MDLLLLITGFVLFVSDLATDIRLAVYYHNKGDNGWFWLTVAFLVVPYIIILLRAAVATGKDFFGCADGIVSLFFCHFKEFMIWRKKYKDNYIYPCEINCEETHAESRCENCEQHRKTIIDECNKSAYLLALIRYIMTIAESAPQWCLQVYIMLVQWDFPWLTVTSTVLSFLSLAWNITTLEKARVARDGYDFKVELPLFFFCQLSTLLSRLFAIAISAYTAKYFFFVFVHLHWVLMNWFAEVLGNCKSNQPCEDQGMCCVYSYFPYLFVINFPFLFHPTDIYHQLWELEKRVSYVRLYTIFSVENVALALIAFLMAGDDANFDSVDGRTPPRWSDTSFFCAPRYLRAAESPLKAP